MYRKIMITGVTAAAIVGAGGTAMALSGSDTSTTPGSGSSSSSSSTAAHAGKHAGKQGKNGKSGKGERGMLRRLQHGQFVTKGKGDTFVTHDLIRGTVTSVSATSITVQSADKKSETFAVNGSTKVRTRTVGKHEKPAASTIGKVVKGDRAMVVGTGASSYTATHIVDVKGAK